jgi:hypothetical protein
MSKSSGLANKLRTGRGTYSRQKKGREADRYGTWNQGVQQTADVICGRTLVYGRKEK